MKKIMITLLTGAMTIGFLGACGDNIEDDGFNMNDDNGFNDTNDNGDANL